MTVPRQAPVKTAAEVASSGSNSASSLAQSPGTTIALGSWEFYPQANEFRGSANFFKVFDVASSAQSLSFDEAMRAIPTLDQERFSQALRKALHAPEPFELEHEVVGRDESVRTVRSRGQLISASGGGTCRVVGTILDITGGRLAHQQLRQREDIFRSLLDNLPDVVWTSAADGSTPYVSPNVERVLGYTAKEICERGDAVWYGMIEPCDVQRITESFQRLFTEGVLFDMEYRAQRKDGRWIWVHDRAHGTHEKAGVRYADGVLSDITERKKADEIRERLAAIVESSDDAIIGKTLTGTITGWNGGAEKLFGYSFYEAVGRPMLMLFPAELAKEESGIIERIARGESVVHYETVRVRKNGMPVEVSVSISPIKDHKGTITGASTIARDITERRRLDKELRLAQFSLEHSAESIFWIDSQGRFTSVNKAACQSVEYSREELLSLSVPDIDPLFSKENWQAFWEDLKTRGSKTIESQQRTKQGQIFPIEVTATYLEFDGQERCLAIVRNVIERKRAEQSLINSKRFLQSTLDALSSHVAILDQKGEIVAVNAAWHRFTAVNEGDEAACGVGSNYFEVCGKANAPNGVEAMPAAAGIRQVIAGTLDEFNPRVSLPRPGSEALVRVEGHASCGTRSRTGGAGPREYYPSQTC
jgi:PAS domain S-box-containing protein